MGCVSWGVMAVVGVLRLSMLAGPGCGWLGRFGLLTCMPDRGSRWMR